MQRPLTVTCLWSFISCKSVPGCSSGNGFKTCFTKNKKFTASEDVLKFNQVDFFLFLNNHLKQEQERIHCHKSHVIKSHWIYLLKVDWKPGLFQLTAFAVIYSSSWKQIRFHFMRRFKELILKTKMQPCKFTQIQNRAKHRPVLLFVIFLQSQYQPVLVFWWKFWHPKLK